MKYVICIGKDVFFAMGEREMQHLVEDSVTNGTINKTIVYKIESTVSFQSCVKMTMNPGNTVEFIPVEG